MVCEGSARGLREVWERSGRCLRGVQEEVWEGSARGSARGLRGVCEGVWERSAKGSAKESCLGGVCEGSGRALGGLWGGLWGL